MTRRAEAIAAFAREEAGAWMVVFRAVLSLGLSGWLAMCLDLPQPGTVMLTTVAVMNRQSGQVLAKGYYRAFGTVCGGVAAVTMAALFAEQPVPFLIALTAWVSACAGAALLQRNFATYGFALAGYTAAVVALPQIEHPVDTFESATNRVIEVLLGVLVAGVVHDIVFPEKLARQIERMAHRQRETVCSQIQSIRQLPDGQAAGTESHHVAVAHAVALEDLRASVIFEDRGAQPGGRRLQRLNHAFMSTTGSLRSLALLLDRLDSSGHAKARAAVIDLFCVSHPAVPVEGEQTKDTREPLADTATRLDQHRLHLAALVSDADRPAFDAGAVLVRRAVSDLHQWGIAFNDITGRGGSLPPSAAPAFSRSLDWQGAAWAALRTGLTMAALAIFWIFSAWPSGSLALLVVAIFSALFGSAADPARLNHQVFTGYATGIVAAFACEFLVLPLMDSYALLMGGAMPFFCIGAYLATRPTWAGFAAGYCLGFVYMLGIKNPMVYAPADFIDAAIANVLGAAFATVTFALFPTLAGTTQGRRGRRRRLDALMGISLHTPLATASAKFESTHHDLVAQMVVRRTCQTEVDALPTDLEVAVALHDIGRTIIELRQALATAGMPAGVLVRADAALAALSSFLHHPRPASRSTALATLQTLSRQSGEDEASHPALSLVTGETGLLLFAISAWTVTGIGGRQTQAPAGAR